MATSTGNIINSKWRANAYYTTSEKYKTFEVTVTLRLENRSDFRYRSTTAEGYYTNGTTKYTGSPSEVGGKAEGEVSTVVAAHTYTYTKGTTASSKKISYSITTKGSIAGGTSSGSFTITVPALERYTITYYPNGGSGSQETQTKYYDKSVTIKASSTFSRSGYSFLRWNTKSNGTGVNYAAGATYSSNAILPLYAQWKQNYNSPKVEIQKCYRTSSTDLTNPDEDDGGTRIFCSVKYTSGYKTAGVYEETTAYIYVNGNFVNSKIVQRGASLITSFNIAGYSVNNSYEVKIKIGDAMGSTYKTQTIPSATYPIDLLTDNDGVFMGLMNTARKNQKVTVPELYINNFKITPPTWIELYGKTTGSTTPTKEINSDYISAFQEGNYDYRCRNEQGVGDSGITPDWCSLSGPGVITINKPSYYKIDLQVYFYNGFTSGDIIMSGILKNYTSTTPGVVSSTINSMKLSQTAPYTTLGGSSIIYCNIGDTIRAYARNSTSNRGSIATSERTRLIVTKI